MNLNQYHKSAIVSCILADLPKIDGEKEKQEAQAALVKGMGQSCKNLYKKSPNALATIHCNGRDYHFGGWSCDLICGDANAQEILAPFKERKKQRDEIKQKIEAALSSVKTRKQFIDRFPEFSAYAPPEIGATSNLPAIANIVAELVSIGWNQKVHKGKVKITK